MSSNFPSEILDQVYQRLDPRRLFAKFDLAERGQRYLGRCPQCGRRELYVLRYDPRYPGLRARCNRLNHCGFSISAWDYLRQVEGVRDEDIMRTLAERAGVDLAALRGSGKDAAEALKRRERRAALHERFWTWATERLWREARHAQSEEARTARFLLARGYSEDLAQAMGLAFLPPPAQTRAWLLEGGKFSPEELQGAPFLDPAFERATESGARIYTLAIPYPELQSLVARTALPREELPADAPKYRYPKGLRLSAPAFLRAADRRRPVIVVEGFLDAALGHALAQRPEGEPYAGALGQLIATGTNRLNAAQVEALEAAGMRELVLCFDQDDAAASPAAAGNGSGSKLLGAGAVGTIATLDRLAEVGTFFPRVLRLPREMECKDPDELITRRGPAAFARLVEEGATSEAQFRAQAVLAVGGAGGQECPPHGGAEGVLAALAEFCEREASRPARALVVAEVVRRVAEALALDAAGLQAALEPFRCRGALKERARLLRQAALAIPLSTSDERPPQAEALARAEGCLRTALERADALANGAGAVAQPVNLAGYAASVAARPEWLETPFRRLDEAAGIHPGRLTLVAARPSHGKTTLLINLLVHWLKRYPERSFVLFSYDGPREQLLSQLISRLTRRYSLREVEEALRGETDGHPEAEQLVARTRAALEWLKARRAEERLFIVDGALTALELTRAARQLAAAGRLGAVLVDYIQQVRPGRRFETRQREVGYVSRALQALAQETGVPVLCAAQLNRVSESVLRTGRPRLWQLREAGDLEQDATTVYGLYNHHQAAQEANGEDDPDASVVGPGVARPKRGRAAGQAPGPALGGWEPSRPGGRWVAPNALRAAPLDVEVLKARHGRTHVRVALTYDLIANHITDGETDGQAEV